MIGQNGSLGLVFLIILLGYFSFLGGVEAAYFADNRTEYLDARADFVESFDAIRINVSSENLTEEIQDINSSEEAEEDLPEWAKDDNAPEWAKNLTESEVSASGQEDVEVPRFYAELIARFLNTGASVGESATVTGMALAWRYGYPIWVLAWAPIIYAGALSPWIVRAWWLWNKRIARRN